MGGDRLVVVGRYSLVPLEVPSADHETLEGTSIPATYQSVNCSRPPPASSHIINPAPLQGWDQTTQAPPPFPWPTSTQSTADILVLCTMTFPLTPPHISPLHLSLLLTTLPTIIPSGKAVTMVTYLLTADHHYSVERGEELSMGVPREAPPPSSSWFSRLLHRR